MAKPSEYLAWICQWQDTEAAAYSAWKEINTLTTRLAELETSTHGATAVGGDRIEHIKRLEARVAELEDHIKQLEYQLKEVGDALLRENKRTNQATREAEDRCVNAILNGTQFFLAGIEPEMREVVVRRALNL
jgi:chromosome segregation ATPase